MNLSVISFTQKGMFLSLRIAEELSGQEVNLFTKCTFAVENSCTYGVQWVQQSVGEWAGEQMAAQRTVLFIGACGIAVRAIAPHITDKLQDAPVLVMDESGRYVIPLLAGHVGGANEAAEYIAARTGATAVLTTATDIRGRFAVDVFAGKNGLQIVNKDGIAKVSAKVLAGQKITVSVEEARVQGEIQNVPEVQLVPWPPEQKTDVLIGTQDDAGEVLLYLRPKEYVIGLGCRKDKEADALEEFISANLKAAGVRENEIYAVASIDRKQREQGIVAWCRKRRIPFLTFSAEQLGEVEGEFHGSAFVQQKVGIDNVCERAALRACKADGKIVWEKHAEAGMTIAIARRKWSVTFDEK